MAGSYRLGEDTASVLSGKLSATRSQLLKKQRIEEEKKIEKYYDLKHLQGKLYTCEKKVKNTIRRTLVRETLAEAERI